MILLAKFLHVGQNPSKNDKKMANYLISKITFEVKFSIKISNILELILLTKKRYISFSSAVCNVENLLPIFYSQRHDAQFRKK